VNKKDEERDVRNNKKEINVIKYKMPSNIVILKNYIENINIKYANYFEK